MNKIFLVGNIGQDPELNRTVGGTAVANSSLATTDGWGENKKTNWHNLVIWGKTGEAFAEHVAKGAKVAIDGRIDYRSWEDNDGNTRYKTEIIVDNWEFAGSKADNGGGEASPKPSAQPKPKKESAVPVAPVPVDDNLPF